MSDRTATLRDIADHPATSDNPLNPIAEMYADEMLDNLHQSEMEREEHLSSKLINSEVPFLLMSIVHSEVEEPIMPRIDERLRVFREIDCMCHFGGYKEVGELRCQLCNKRFHVGDPWRWLNGPVDSPLGNFTVCETCSTPDAVERYTIARNAIAEATRDF